MSAPTEPTPVVYLSYGDVKSYLEPRLKARGFDCVIDPGPATNASLQRRGVQRMLFITVGGGAGLSLDGAFERPFITCRWLGKQGDSHDAEKFAMATDRLLCDFQGGRLGLTQTTYITQTGGRPQLVERDLADRYHFTGSYIAQAETGL